MRFLRSNGTKSTPSYRRIAKRGRRIDPALVVIVLPGLILAGMNLPRANSLESIAYCFGPLVCLVSFYLAGSFLARMLWK